ncbi:MAG: septum formation protein Maf [Alphaproteobacteria bacterium]|nr:septum formation protein Maf [Alphaproteobacteria bacterium]
MTNVILASGSSTRQAMLRNAGVDFAVDVASIDEASVLESLEAEHAKPREAADMLAEMKAVKVSTRHQDALVIGADQILSLGTKFFSKPRDLAAARAQLQALRGHTHQLTSAVVVARNGSAIWREVREAKLTMRPFSNAFLDEYLADVGDAALTSVGAYQIEGRGAQLFSRIDGDHFTILGLPLLPLLDMLRAQGVLKT